MHKTIASFHINFIANKSCLLDFDPPPETLLTPQTQNPGKYTACCCLGTLGHRIQRGAAISQFTGLSLTELSTVYSSAGQHKIWATFRKLMATLGRKKYGNLLVTRVHVRRLLFNSNQTSKTRKPGLPGSRRIWNGLSRSRPHVATVQYKTSIGITLRAASYISVITSNLATREAPQRHRALQK